VNSTKCCINIEQAEPAHTIIDLHHCKIIAHSRIANTATATATTMTAHTDCAVCKPGYARVAGYRCQECTRRSIVLTVVLLVVSFSMSVLFIWLLVANLMEHGQQLEVEQLPQQQQQQQQQTPQRYSTAAAQEASAAAAGFARESSSRRELLRKRASVAVKRLRTAPFGQLRTPLVVFQILTQFVFITGAELPPLYRSFLRLVDVVNLNMQWLVPSGCIVDLNFHHKLLIITLLPLVVVAALAVAHVRARSQARRAHDLDTARGRQQFDDAVAAAFAKHSMVLLVFTFLIFSVVSTTVLQTFACDLIDEVDKSWLRADYSILCTSATHRAYQAYAAVMIFVYPLGIPAFYSWLLYRNRAHITAAGSDAERADDTVLSMTRFLWEPYRKEAYWWEVAECIRRLALTGFLVFVLPGTAGQAAVACVFAFLSMMAFGIARPHRSAADLRAYWLGCIILVLSMFVSLLLQGDAAALDSQSQSIMSVILIVLSVGLVAAAVRHIGAAVVMVLRPHSAAAAPPVRRRSSLLQLLRRASGSTGSIPP
jgi:lysylphosphatidylglycerol synthetase-like protein (DUF2156 family)